MSASESSRASSRRAFLKAMGAFGLAMPFARLLKSDIAHAADSAPLRFIALFTPHGLLPEYWTPKNGETDFAIDYENSFLGPLANHRSKLLVIDGLDYRVLYEYRQSGHEGGPVTFLTGSQMSSSEQPLSISLDQAIADKLTGVTKFRSLELLAFQQFAGQHVYNTISFSKTGTRQPFERDPANVYQRLFADLVVGAPSPEQQAALARKKSLLAYLNKDVKRLQGRLAGPERQKLDAHLTAIESIERRLSGPGAGCTKPTAPAKQTSAYLGNAANWPAILKLHFDLVAQAFACDLTRVVTMPILAAPNMPWLGLTESIHDDIAHQIDLSDAAARAAVRLKMVKVQRWYAEQVAYLMDRLAEIPEGNGTVLDNTIILWGNELGNPAGHSSVGIPTVLAGGAGGKLRMGRFLRLRPGVNPLAGWGNFGDKAPNAVAHNKLLVSLAKCFGITGETFGQPDYVGELAGLT